MTETQALLMAKTQALAYGEDTSFAYSPDRDSTVKRKEVIINV